MLEKVPDTERGADIHAVVGQVFLLFKRKNKNGTLRTFANLIGVSPALMSLVLSGKRRASAKLIRSLLVVDMSRADRLALLKWLAVHDEIKQIPNIRAEAPEYGFDELELEQFEMIANPEHFSILTLLRSESTRFTVQDVAALLNLDNFFVEVTVNRLKRLRMLTVDKNQHLKLLAKPKTTSKNIPSAAIRAYHRSKLNSSLAALVHIPVAERDFSSVSMLIDSSKIAEIQADIEKMRRKIFKKYDTKSGNCVYDLNVQLIPVIKKILNS